MDELQIGDVFYIHVLDKILAYKIYETKVILPEKIDELQITSGKDYVTLVTCTPYGVNSHRLLVKGERAEYSQTVNQNSENHANNHLNAQTENKQDSAYLKGIKIGLLLLVIIIIMVIIGIRIYKKKKSAKL